MYCYIVYTNKNKIGAYCVCINEKTAKKYVHNLILDGNPNACYEQRELWKR